MSIAVCPTSAEVSALNENVKSFVVATVTRFGKTVIFPTPARTVAAPPDVASASATAVASVFVIDPSAPKREPHGKQTPRVPVGIRRMQEHGDQPPVAAGRGCNEAVAGDRRPAGLGAGRAAQGPAQAGPVD